MLLALYTGKRGDIGHWPLERERKHKLGQKGFLSLQVKVAMMKCFGNILMHFI
jgi:hypothetical protein